MFGRKKKKDVYSQLNVNKSIYSPLYEFESIAPSQSLEHLIYNILQIQYMKNAREKKDKEYEKPKTYQRVLIKGDCFRIEYHPLEEDVVAINYGLNANNNFSNGLILDEGVRREKSGKIVIMKRVTNDSKVLEENYLAHSYKNFQINLYVDKLQQHVPSIENSADAENHETNGSLNPTFEEETKENNLDY